MFIYLKKNQFVEEIPVTLVKYNYRGEKYKYKIYGIDHQVYASEYPQKCLCCSIL